MCVCVCVCVCVTVCTEAWGGEGEGVVAGGAEAGGPGEDLDQETSNYNVVHIQWNLSIMVMHPWYHA